MDQSTFPISFAPIARDELVAVAAAQLHNGQVQILDQNAAPLGALQQHFLTRLQANVDAHMRPISDAYPAVALQLGAIIPAYLKGLFDEFGLTPGQDDIPGRFALVEPLAAKDPKNNRGHFQFPFSVIDPESALYPMEILQHSLSTLLHEVLHAMSRQRIVIVDSRVMVRQDGLRILTPPRKNTPSRLLFSYFNEGLAALTQAHFLMKYMNFRQEDLVRSLVLEGAQPLVLNGVNLYPALKRVGRIAPATSGRFTGREVLYLPYWRYSQGKMLTPEEVCEAARGLSGKTSSNDNQLANQVTSSHAKYEEISQRQYVYHDSGYGAIERHMRMLAIELYGDQIPQAAQSCFHRDLLKAALSANLTQLTKRMRDVFGAPSARYIRALAQLSNTPLAILNSTTGKYDPNLELCAFVAFVHAGNLPPTERDKIRSSICDAILGHTGES